MASRDDPYPPYPDSRRTLNVREMVDERLLLIEAKRVLDSYLFETRGAWPEYLDPRSVANELLDDGYESESLITLMTLRPWELHSEGQAELANALRELGVRQLTLREATLVLARDETRQVFAGDLSPWKLLSRLDSLYFWSNKAAPELWQLVSFWPDDPEEWGDRRKEGERMILDMAQPLLAYAPG